MNDGLIYSVPLMMILLCHELGHYIVARRHGVDASLPYFIPFPFGPLGTLGAVIGMRQSSTDRKKLIDVGAAGPLAGLAIAIPVLVVGLLRSHLGPRVHDGAALMEGNSILYAVLKRLTKGAWLPSSDVDVDLDPMAYAGWAGLLITMINLMPIGQLDGGHVATAYFGNRYGRFADRLRRLLPVVAVGVFFWVRHAVKEEMVGALGSVRRFAGRDERRDVLAGLVSAGLADAAAVGRRESSARGRPAAAPEPAGAVLADGRRVRDRVHARADAGDSGPSGGARRRTPATSASLEP